MRLLQMSISGALLISLTALLRMAALRILPKRAFLLFWGIVLLRLLVPFPPFIRVPVPEVIAEQEETAYTRDLSAGTLARNDASPAPRPSHPPTDTAETWS